MSWPAGNSAHPAAKRAPLEKKKDIMWIGRGGSFAKFVRPENCDKRWGIFILKG